jgi:hypothetical protein
MYALIDHCQAAIALPGGVGTLAEIAVTWSQLQTGASESKPLILVGSSWKSVFEKLYAELGPYVAEKDRQLLIFSPDVQHAVEQLANLS